MGIWSRVFRAPRRVKFDSAAPVTIDAAILAARNGGASISRTEALSVPAVQRGRNMLCSIATLPLVQRGPDRQTVDNPLFMQLDADVANVVTLAQTVEDLVFDAVSWWRITALGFDGYPTKVRHLDVGSVSLTPPAGTRSPLPSGLDPHDAVIYVDGVEVSVRDVIRFDSPNPAVLDVGGRAIRRALLLDKAAQMYADDPRPADFFSPADGSDPVDDDDVADILSKWKTARKKRSTAWVPQSMKYNTVDSPSPADLQLVELQKQASLDIANALGIDPEDLGVSTTSRTYQNDVDRRRGRINDVLAPYMRAITDRLSMGDVTKRGHTVTFVLDDYLKSNPSERVAVQKAYVDMGAIDVQEVREAEGWAGPAPGRAEEPADDPNEAAAIDAARRVLQRFSMRQRFDSSKLTFANLPMTTFRVDAATRTIEGLGLLYNVVGNNGAAKFKFIKGSLSYGEVGRVKLLRDHDMTQPLGKATRLKDTSAGFAVAFKVARGAEGDRALELAEDGVLDGLSVGVDIEDFDVDPKDNSVYLIRKATLREVSLTAMPAFDDARVTSVAASRTQGENTVDDDTEPTTAPAAPASVPGGSVTLTTEQFNAMLNRSAAPERPAIPEQRQVVDATRRTGAMAVTEPAPYRFDRKGNILPGSHEFSNDLITGLRDGDQAAQDRALTFIRQQFDVVTTDVNELSPTRNRPEMYVDQRTFKYPVWDAINKGTLTDITPFTFPKFSSAGSLVAAHTEGVEPSSGTFVTTSGTVTPTANSGKAKISRETWDQGGNPQIGNLIWNQMLKGWYEALEAAAVAVLDAATPTGIDFSGTPGLANDDLDQAITAAFAGLQFIRGGFSMNKMFTQIDLYKALVAAQGTDGRRLYPALGPTNAGGTVGPRFGSLDINGVEALPAWALAATGTVAASSYLFDSDSVHGWASAPQRLTIDMTEVANVYIGIWGYKATVISDINGVREIIYDPA